MKYLGIKVLQDAKPMTLGEYNTYREWPIPENEDPEREGYWVEYKGGYESWSPKEEFEAAYMAVGDNNTVTQEMVEDFISSYETIKLGDKTTVVKVVLKNGFVIVESASCVDPANFDMALGKNICLGKINDQVWSHLGFLLQTGVHGLKED